MKAPLITPAVILVASPVLALTDIEIMEGWAANNQVYVTRLAQREALEQVRIALELDKFKKGTAGTVASTTAKVEPEAREQEEERAYRSAARAGTRAAFDDFLVKYPSGRYADLARDQLARAAPLPSSPPAPKGQLSVSITGWLERFPTIRLVVQPAPPRDYSVTINGEDCPATERGLYKVPSGPIEVRVLRTGKTPCLWSGTLVESRTQEVSCNL